MRLQTEKLLLFGALTLLGPGCATSSYLVNSNPPGASVYYFDPQTQKKFLMGTTPLSYGKGSLPKESAFTMSVEKDGFLTQELPVAPTDESKTIINVTLKNDPTGSGKSNREINTVVTGLFRAQQMIYKRQYQAAIIELDQILKEKPDVVQAHVMRGTTFYLMNEMASAVDSWKKAYKIDPSNEELTRFLLEKNIVLK
jgi:tetratricopeptide (TPR) repeat protein